MRNLDRFAVCLGVLLLTGCSSKVDDIIAQTKAYCGFEPFAASVAAIIAAGAGGVAGGPAGAAAAGAVVSTVDGIAKEICKVEVAAKTAPKVNALVSECPKVNGVCVEGKFSDHP
jgi:hypothetical protein